MAWGEGGDGKERPTEPGAEVPRREQDHASVCLSGCLLLLTAGGLTGSGFLGIEFHFSTQSTPRAWSVARTCDKVSLFYS